MFELSELKNLPKSREVVDRIIDMHDQSCSLESVQKYIDSIERSNELKEKDNKSTSLQEAIRYLSWHKKGLHDTGYNARCAETAIKTLANLVHLKSDLKLEIHRLERVVLDKTISDEEKIKALITLECYSKVLNQLNN